MAMKQENKLSWNWIKLPVAIVQEKNRKLMQIRRQKLQSSFSTCRSDNSTEFCANCQPWERFQLPRQNVNLRNICVTGCSSKIWQRFYKVNVPHHEATKHGAEWFSLWRHSTVFDSREYSRSSHLMRDTPLAVTSNNCHFSLESVWKF